MHKLFLEKITIVAVCILYQLCLFKGWWVLCFTLHLTNSSKILTAQRFVDLTPLKSVQASSNNCNIVHISRGDETHKNLVGSEQVCLGVISSKTLLLAVNVLTSGTFYSSGLNARSLNVGKLALWTSFNMLQAFCWDHFKEPISFATYLEKSKTWW